jgi:uncharacterized protein DUF6755
VNDRRAPWIDRRELQPVVPPGRRALLLIALVIGVLMLGIQLWLLTVALDLFLGGHGSEVWTLALFSGAIFLGGLAADRLFGRRLPRR